MHNVVMQNVEITNTRKSTERMVKILESTYVKADLKQVVNNATQLNAKERTLLLRLLENFEEFLMLL